MSTQTKPSQVEVLEGEGGSQGISCPWRPHVHPHKGLREAPTQET